MQVDYLSDYPELMRGCGLLMEISARESADLQMNTVASNVYTMLIFHPIVGRKSSLPEQLWDFGELGFDELGHRGSMGFFP